MTDGGTDKPGDLKKRTAKAFAWSALMSASVKFLALALFFVLARYLTPTQMGMAQSVMLILALTAMLAEQSLHGALVQPPQLHRDDANLPFMVSVGTASVLALGMLVFAPEISAMVGKEPIDDLIRLAAIVPPIVAANGIQVAMFRRALDFRTIAIGTVVASIVSGLASLSLAVMGYGALSIVVQAIASTVVLGLMIWRRPVWLPGLQVSAARAKPLFAFSTTSFASVLVEFLSSRLIDFIILKRFGFTELGLFTVGVKVSQSLMELAGNALFDVAFTAFSRLSTDVARLRDAYLRLAFLAASGVAPFFIGISALAPEICRILFGARWAGSELVLAAFGALGAIVVLMMFNFAVLNAVGKPGRNLQINLLKLAAGALVLAFYPAQTMGELALAFVASQMAVAPVSFFAAMAATQTRAIPLLRRLLPGLVAAACAHAIVGMARDLLAPHVPQMLLMAALLSVIFAAAYLVLLVAFCRHHLRDQLAYAVDSFPALRRLQPLLRR